ncbi:MAG TPA: EAL domain-containing protein [Paenibacillus sp.]|uniref:putative bifunctional diguanylate cyclase/phosphodiesterase n=1 Tax=Paenibacillus sp. TaxID=58172 RepID=UPI002BAD2B9C|nr:EAL domain-containing protein [Paenibacillus sp.]HUC92456.1 EAL domain-containing protein [Paenibacillus sp.]
MFSRIVHQLKTFAASGRALLRKHIGSHRQSGHGDPRFYEWIKTGKNRLAAHVVDHISEGIVVTDSKQAVQYINKAFTQITGYTEQDIVGRTPRLLSSGKHPPEFYRGMWSDIAGTGKWAGDIWNRRKNGETFLESISITTVRDRSGSALNYIGVFKDVTVQRKLEEQIRFQAYHDSVTRLPNRNLLEERMAASIASVADGDRFMAVLFLDLDRFKRINDTLGHAAGDRLLKTIADRLTGCLVGEATIARFGGDEFVVVVPNLPHTDDSSAIAQKIILLLTSPFYIDQHELYVTVSIGISHYPIDAAEPYMLIKYADQAMYKAKELGRNNFQLYASGEHPPLLQPLSLELSLRRAILNEGLTIHNQPQINAATGEIVGVEALVRWQHPEWGFIAPVHFIPLAEEIGLITLLDQWVLRQACIQAAAWQQQGYAPIRISVNLSMLQFRQPNLGSFIAETLSQTGLAPEYLEIELTESIVMSNPEMTMRTLHQLKEMGIRISLDDFGVGYSSLNYLKKLPIDTIKIDQSFVRDIPQDPDDRAIVQTIIHLSHNLSLSVIAEGVENDEQLHFLKLHECEEIQGYLFSRPLPTEEMTRLLTAAPHLS